MSFQPDDRDFPGTAALGVGLDSQLVNSTGSSTALETPLMRFVVPPLFPSRGQGPQQNYCHPTAPRVCVGGELKGQIAGFGTPLLKISLLVKHFHSKYDLYCFLLLCSVAFAASGCLGFFIISPLPAPPSATTTSTNKQSVCQCSFLPYLPFLKFI